MQIAPASSKKLPDEVSKVADDLRVVWDSGYALFTVEHGLGFGVGSYEVSSPLGNCSDEAYAGRL